MTRKTSKQLKFVAFIMSLVMLMTVAPFSAFAEDGVIYTSEAIDQTVLDDEIISDVEPAAVENTAVLTAADVPEFIAMSDLTTRGTIRRVYEEETDLSTILFENNDGTRTLYMYGVPVKYVAPDGTTRDKSTAISSLSGLQALWNGSTLTPSQMTTLAQNASIGRLELGQAAEALSLMNMRLIATYGATLKLSDMAYASLDSDIRSLYPTAVSDGVVLNYGDYSIRTIPVATGSLVLPGAANIAESTSLTDNDVRTRVRYGNAFGLGTILQYTPTTMGVKEEIILTSNVGKDSFLFRIETGGLTIEEENGNYFFFDPATQRVIAQLGEIIAYDSNGQIARGAVTVQSVIVGQRYNVTISVSPEFLANAAYPVSVDPTCDVCIDPNDQRIQFRAIYDNAAAQGIANSWELDFGTHYRNGVEYCGRVYTRFADFSGLMSANHIESEEQIDSFKLYYPGYDMSSAVSMTAQASLISWTSDTVFGSFAYSSFGDPMYTRDSSNVERNNEYVPYFDLWSFSAWWLIYLEYGVEAPNPDNGFLVILDDEDSNNYRVWYMDVYATLTYQYTPSILSVSNNTVVMRDESSSTITASSSTGGTITASSSALNIATVSVSGGNIVIYAQNPGVAEITVRAGTNTEKVEVFVAPPETQLPTEQVYMINPVGDDRCLSVSTSTVTLSTADAMDGRQLWYMEWQDGVGYKLCSMGKKLPTEAGAKEAYLSCSSSSNPSFTVEGTPWLIYPANGDTYYFTPIVENMSSKTLSCGSSSNVALSDNRTNSGWTLDPISRETFNNYYPGTYARGFDDEGILHIKIVFDESLTGQGHLQQGSNGLDYNVLTKWNDYSSKFEIHSPYGTNVPESSFVVTIKAENLNGNSDPFGGGTIAGRTRFFNSNGQEVNLYAEDDIYRAEIVLDVDGNTYNFQSTNAVLLHEMGHVLKLAHPKHAEGIETTSMSGEQPRGAYSNDNCVVALMNQGSPSDSSNLAAVLPSKHDIINLRNKFGG